MQFKPLSNLLDNEQKLGILFSMFPEENLTEETLKEWENNFKAPKRKTPSSACYDLHLNYPVTLQPKEKKLVVFDFILEGELPQAARISVAARSSLYKKKGITFVIPHYIGRPNSPLFVEIINRSDKESTIEAGEDFCQLGIFESVENPVFDGVIERIPHEGEEESNSNLNEFVKDGLFPFKLDCDVVLEPQQSVLNFTNIRSSFKDNQVLLLLPTEKLVSEGIILPNGIGVIDADYYKNKDNGGNIGIGLYNNSYTNYSIRAGETVATGIILEYFTVEDDIPTFSNREGGFGSTDTQSKEEETIKENESCESCTI